MSQNGIKMESFEYTQFTPRDQKQYLEGMIKNAEQQYFEATTNAAITIGNDSQVHVQRAQMIAQAIQKLKQQLADLDRSGAK